MRDTPLIIKLKTRIDHEYRAQDLQYILKYVYLPPYTPTLSGYIKQRIVKSPGLKLELKGQAKQLSGKLEREAWRSHLHHLEKIETLRRLATHIIKNKMKINDCPILKHNIVLKVAKQ